ncbi:Tim44/TimA family putative adaptor protein [Polymorphobacter fuscus]|nr:Tim44/TimA family putative adaptor protein [Polymorphobacter fuscus]NJC08196.1 putative lipid-binding transport protein (Tim44 family) [Polymorphobacter fuscus]
MSDGSSWIEIVLLAMLAAFIGLRLVSVLGKRTGHERAVGDAFRPGAPEITAPSQRPAAKLRGVVAVPTGTDGTLAPKLQAIVDADPEFNPERFVAGARSAYGMILSAFWASDSRALEGLVSDEIADNFGAAIGERDGARLANSLDSIESAAIVNAEMIGQMAEVTVRFNARVTIAGTPTNTVDVWTFSRHIGSRDPAWLLIATDDDTPGDGNLDA